MLVDCVYRFLYINYFIGIVIVKYVYLIYKFEYYFINKKLFVIFFMLINEYLFSVSGNNCRGYF